ncbi:MAG: acyl-CoA dehydratase activase [candidate division Zixibacteria bacterium]
MDYYAGIDIGASTTKAVIIDDNREIIGHAVVDSGADFEKAGKQAFDSACEMCHCDNPDEIIVTSTGYGRNNVPFAKGTMTEISCHATGSYHYFPFTQTLIDIGGQDSKTIKINESGKRTNFKMNRKCAAGTGAFLEEIAIRLKIPLEQLNELAEKAEKTIPIGSYCTVFTGTEILARIREGVAVADIVKGIFISVIKRVLEMDTMDGNIVMSGGVIAHNPYLVKMFEERIGQKVYVPPHPQLTGAFGAALYSINGKGGFNA